MQVSEGSIVTFCLLTTLVGCCRVCWGLGMTSHADWWLHKNSLQAISATAAVPLSGRIPDLSPDPFELLAQPLDQGGPRDVARVEIFGGGRRPFVQTQIAAPYGLDQTDGSPRRRNQVHAGRRALRSDRMASSNEETPSASRRPPDNEWRSGDCAPFALDGQLHSPNRPPICPDTTWRTGGNDEPFTLSTMLSTSDRPAAPSLPRAPPDTTWRLLDSEPLSISPTRSTQMTQRARFAEGPGEGSPRAVRDSRWRSGERDCELAPNKR